MSRWHPKKVLGSLPIYLLTVLGGHKFMFMPCAELYFLLGVFDARVCDIFILFTTDCQLPAYSHTFLLTMAQPNLLQSGGSCIITILCGHFVLHHSIFSALNSGF